MKRTIIAGLASVAASAALALGAAPAAAAAPASAAASHGCPSGAVCLYPDASWNGGQPVYVWWSYGAHNLTDVYGVHRFYNNQTGGAIARNCTGYNGTGCQGAQAANTYADYDYTPYNSVVLAPN